MKINVIAENDKVEISSREKQIIHVAILNILALLNAIITQKGMVPNPIEDDSENLGYEVHFRQFSLKRIRMNLKEELQIKSGHFYLCQKFLM